MFFWFIQFVRCTFSFLFFSFFPPSSMPVGLSFVFVFCFFKIFICLLCTYNASLHCKYTKVVNIIHICTKNGRGRTRFSQKNEKPIITSRQPVRCTGFFKKKKTILQLSFAALNQNVSRLTNQIIQLNGEDPSIT